MSYRYPNNYSRESAQRGPSVPAMMGALIGAFVVLSLIVLLAGRLPFAPTPADLSGVTYRDYVGPDRVLLETSGRTPEGQVHIPIDRAMDLIVERGLPVRDTPSATP